METIARSVIFALFIVSCAHAVEFGSFDGQQLPTFQRPVFPTTQQRNALSSMPQQTSRNTIMPLMTPSSDTLIRMQKPQANQGDLHTVSTSAEARPLSVCEPNPCFNMGECSMGANGEAVCACTKFFMGQFCQEAAVNNGRGFVSTMKVNGRMLEVASGCSADPCQNEGVCTSTGPTQYTCKCPWGFTGVNCEICLTECASNPCTNGKKCKALYGGGYECVCPSNRTGKNCDIENDICAIKPCSNGGQCKPVEGGTFTCTCLHPWAGDSCTDVWQNPCTEEALRAVETIQFPNPWDRQSYLICTGPQVYEMMPCSVGTYFNKNLAHCVPEGYNPPACPANHCSNDGECIVDETHTLQCICKKGFSGDKCEVDVDECFLGGNDACAGGKCVDQRNGYYCACPSGRIGLNCRDTIEAPCTSANMANDHHYFTFPSPAHDSYVHCSGVNRFAVRRCAEGLFWHEEEKTCHIERAAPRSLGVCQTIPCRNGAECVDTGSSFQCVCKKGYTGEFCEQMIDYCLSSPCKNGGRCMSYAGGYTCVCPDKIVDDCCCHGLINPCPPKNRLLPGVNNYFAHIFPNKYFHCDFDGRAFVRGCAPGSRWSQEANSCKSSLEGDEKMSALEAFKPKLGLQSSSLFGLGLSSSVSDVKDAAPALPRNIPLPPQTARVNYGSSVLMPQPANVNYAPILPPQSLKVNGYLPSQAYPDQPRNKIINTATPTATMLSRRRLLRL